MVPPPRAATRGHTCGSESESGGMRGGMNPHVERRRGRVAASAEADATALFREEATLAEGRSQRQTPK